jgi:hypothetical protein
MIVRGVMAVLTATASKAGWGFPRNRSAEDRMASASHRPSVAQLA